MTLYSSLSRLFPTSFVAKVFFIAFVGTHVPLLATVFFMFAQRGGLQGNLDLALVILLATLVGTGATLLSLRAVLVPLFRVRDAMVAFKERGERADLPTGFRDELGTVMKMTDRLILHVDHKIKKTQDVADTDALTGLLNRRGFDRAVGDAKSGAVIYLDLDEFKSVNDAFGHDAGDDVLRATAAILRTALRENDILARFGGEEFVAFLPDIGEDEAWDAAERARTSIEQTVHVGDRAITASFGVAMHGADLAINGTVKRADAAAYSAKRDGRNRVAIWIEGIGDRVPA